MSAAVVARGVAPPAFDARKAVFDFAPAFVERLIVRLLERAALFRRDAGLDASVDQRLAKGIAIVALIAGQRS